MSVSLFGSPQIRRGSEQISVQRRKDLALLIYLVVNPQVHSRDTLAALLWPDLNQADARSNLRKSLSRLKMQLGENCLLVSQEQIGLHPNLSLDLDIEKFGMSLVQLREHGHRQDEKAPYLCALCQRSLEEAAQLYKADFLSGFDVPDSATFEEWQFFQSESLRKNLAEILEHLTQQFTHLEDYPVAIEFCRRWVSLDRLHEPPHRQLMLLYALSGQQAAAIRQFEELQHLLQDELDVQPEPETLQLYEAIRKKQIHKQREGAESFTHQAGISTSLSMKETHHLPPSSTPFVGRERELEEITRIVREPASRLLTLLGPGGSGKTRLALQSGTRLGERTDELFQDGVFFISLAPLTDPEAIVSALLGGLKITGQARGVNGREKLLGYLPGRRILLILDNFEHLLGDESIALISEIISVAPLSRILITSRERLNLQGEQIFRVEGLEIPKDRAHLSKLEFDSVPQAYSALQLFMQCASRVQPSFAITVENYETIAQICRMVEGMPLAIEMAASWLEILSPEEIRVEISRSLDFLQSNMRDLPDRQRSLRAVFESSWALLDRQNRPILKALSVFRAGFTREAAQAVAGVSVKSLLDLTNKSWLQRYASGRYQIHELLRQFCFEKLRSEDITFEQVKRQYCDYYASFGSSLWRAMKGRGQRSAFSAVGEELENINTAWIWLVEKNQIETAIESLLPALFYYSEVRDLPQEFQLLVGTSSKVSNMQRDPSGHPRWETIMKISMTIPGRFNMYEEIGFGIQKEALQRVWSLLEQQGDSLPVDYWGIRLAYAYGNFVNEGAAVHYLEQAVSKLQATDQAWELAIAYLCLVRLQVPHLSGRRDDETTSEHSILNALNIFTALGDELNMSYTLMQLGNLRYKQERLEEAIDQWRLAQAAFTNLDEWSIANNMIRLIGDAYLQLGQFEAAFRSFDQIAQISFEHGHVQQAVGGLSKESFEMVRYGDLEEARRLRQQCIELIEAAGPAYQIGWNYWEMGEILRVMGQLDEAAGWYERSRKPFETYTEDDVWKVFYFRGFGDIALARGDFKAAVQQFSQSLELAMTTRHEWAVIYALNGLGRSELGANNTAAARQHFQTAFQSALKTRDYGITLVALAGYAELLCQQGESEMALQICSLVNHHYATWRETKDLTSSLLTSLKKTMTAAAFKQARKRGEAMDLWETVRDLIERE